MHQRLEALKSAHLHQSEMATRHHREAPRWQSLALLDIDHFKHINDQHGHDVGDAVLIGIAQALRTNLPEGSACARWGGEEFLLLLQGGLREACRVLDEVRSALFARKDWPGAMVVSCSIGIAEIDQHLSIAEWVKRADLALYTAKRSGRNQVVAFGPDLPAPNISEQRIRD
jgi:diguanylate cyclase (GGDEF)-like protein